MLQPHTPMLTDGDIFKLGDGDELILRCTNIIYYFAVIIDLCLHSWSWLGIPVFSFVLHGAVTDLFVSVMICENECTLCVQNLSRLQVILLCASSIFTS